MSALLEAALAYAARGWPVLAVRPHGKDPLIPRGVNGATTDPATITLWWRRWPDANVAIACGHPGPQVLDIDDLDKAAPDLARLADIPTGATARGRHLYFRGLDEGTISVGYGELRGRGSYVVAPPSTHPSGKAYVWLLEANGALPPVPAFLAGAGQGAGRGAHQPPPERIVDGEGRWPYLRDFAVRLVRAGITDEAVLLVHIRAEFEARCEPDPPPERGKLEALVRWAANTRIADRERARHNLHVVDDLVEPRTLDQLVDAFKTWLHLPDEQPLLAVLGAVAANLIDGDPVWFVLVAAPSSGKSELLAPLVALPYVHPAATITEAALLSGTPKKDVAAGARGGLLRALGDFGIVLCKDFGSVLSMDRSERARVLGALREVYDGSWTRHIGSEGGRTLHWEGKAGLLAAATPTLDRHHAVMASMGERFLLYRLPASDPAEQARFSLKRTHGGRDELRDHVLGLFARELPTPRPLTDAEVETLIQIATLCAAARSTVERDGYSREIELIPGSEAPARLAQQLAQLLAGLDVIGVTRTAALTIVRKAALDSIPALRRQAIDALNGAGVLTTPDIAKEIRYPTSTTRRALEDLAGHGVVLREAGGPGKTDRWQLAEWAADHLSRNVGSAV